MNIKKAMQQLPDASFPEHLHQKIMRSVRWQQSRVSVGIFALLIGFNLIVSAFHLWARLVEFDTIAVFKELMGSFEISYDFFQDVLSTAATTIPLNAMMIFSLNFFLSVYAFYFFRQFKNIAKVD